MSVSEKRSSMTPRERLNAAELVINGDIVDCFVTDAEVVIASAEREAFQAGFESAREAAVKALTEAMDPPTEFSWMLVDLVRALRAPNSEVGK